jgi:hypothetical protein
VHGRKAPLARFARHSLLVSVVMLRVLAMGTGIASASQSAPMETDADVMSFGLLGPVGLVAVALGVIGMALGVIRQRRKVSAKPQAATEVVEEPVTAQLPDEPAPLPPLPVEGPSLASYRRSA